MWSLIWASTWSALWLSLSSRLCQCRLSRHRHHFQSHNSTQRLPLHRPLHPPQHLASRPMSKPRQILLWTSLAESGCYASYLECRPLRYAFVVNFGQTVASLGYDFINTNQDVWIVLTDLMVLCTTYTCECLPSFYEPLLLKWFVTIDPDNWTRDHFVWLRFQSCLFRWNGRHCMMSLKPSA